MGSLAVTAVEPPAVEPAVVAGEAVMAAEPPAVEPAVVAGEAVMAAEPPAVEPCLWAVWKRRQLSRQWSSQRSWPVRL